MDKRRYHIIQFICIMVVLVAIALQGFTHKVKMKPLDGVVADETPVELNFKNYLDGSYQAYLTEHAKRNTGFREFFIRAYNQMCYSCFNLISNNTIIKGKNGELFITSYLDDVTGKRVEEYYSTVDNAKAAAQENVKLTLRLMDTLKQHGTDFLFVFAPSKTAVYPEYIPEPYCNQLTDFSLADYYIELFKENDIPLIDFYSYFKEIKDKFPYPLYTKYGTHWAISTIPYVSDSILRKMESLTGKALPSIEITDLNPTTDYYKQDCELEGQMNLLFPLRKPALPYPKYILTDTLGKDKPNLVIIADSYFVPFENSCFLEAFNSWNYVKYNDFVISSNPDYNWKKFELLPEAYNIMEDADIVMALFTSPMLYNYMFGFPDTVLKLFNHGEPTDEERIEMIIQNIRNVPEWYDAVVKQAEEQGITVEENLRINAIYVIQHEENNNP